MGEWEEIEPDKKTQLAKALKNVILLNCFTPEQINQLLDESKIRNFGTGEMILLKGEISESLFVIGSGTAVVCLKKAPVTLSGAQYFGEISLFLKKPVTCTVKAGDKGVRILALPGNYLREMVNNNPQAKKILEKIISNRIPAAPSPAKKPNTMVPPKKT